MLFKSVIKLHAHCFKGSINTARSPWRPHIKHCIENLYTFLRKHIFFLTTQHNKCMIHDEIRSIHPAFL